jgi:hypothetical protein
MILIKFNTVKGEFYVVGRDESQCRDKLYDFLKSRFPTEVINTNSSEIIADNDGFRINTKLII